MSTELSETDFWEIVDWYKKDLFDRMLENGVACQFTKAELKTLFDFNVPYRPVYDRATVIDLAIEAALRANDFVLRQRILEELDAEVPGGVN